MTHAQLKRLCWSAVKDSHSGDPEEPSCGICSRHTEIKGLLLPCNPQHISRDIYYKTQDRDKLETKPSGLQHMQTTSKRRLLWVTKLEQTQLGVEEKQRTISTEFNIALKHWKYITVYAQDTLCLSMFIYTFSLFILIKKSINK